MVFPVPGGPAKIIDVSPVGGEHSGQQLAWSEDVRLAEDLVERARSHAQCQGLGSAAHVSPPFGEQIGIAAGEGHGAECTWRRETWPRAVPYSWVGDGSR